MLHVCSRFHSLSVPVKAKEKIPLHGTSGATRLDRTDPQGGRFPESRLIKDRPEHSFRMKFHQFA